MKRKLDKLIGEKFLEVEPTAGSGHPQEYPRDHCIYLPGSAAPPQTVAPCPSWGQQSE